MSKGSPVLEIEGLVTLIYKHPSPNPPNLQNFGFASNNGPTCQNTEMALRHPKLVNPLFLRKMHRGGGGEGPNLAAI